MRVFVSPQFRENCILRFWQETNLIHAFLYPFHSFIDVPTSSVPIDQVALSQGSGEGCIQGRFKYFISPKEYVLLASCPISELFI